MDLDLPEMFVQDAWRAQLGYALYAACVLLLALFLQTAPAANRLERSAVGLFITAVLLVVQPFLYHSETQTYSIGIASACCLGAFTLCHWTFIEALHYKPTIREVCMSVFTHPLSGVIKVYKRTQRQHALKAAQQQQQPAAASPKASTGMRLRSGRPLVVVDATGIGDMEPPVSHASPAQGALPALIKAMGAMLAVGICYDVGLFLLCTLSNGMCSPASTGMDTPAPALTSTGVGTWALEQTSCVLQSRFMAVCVFAYAAGTLLTVQMDLFYSFLRASMCAGAFFWPVLGAYAAQLPAQAFNLGWPGACRSVGELWGWRWHQFLRFAFEGLGYTSIDKLLPQGKAVSPAVRSSMHTVAAFLMSACMHEYLTWAAWGTVTGWYMAFFGLHCAAVLLEGWGPLMLKLIMQQAPVVKRMHAVGPTVQPGVSSPAPAGVRSASHGSGTGRRHGQIMPAWAKRVWAFAVMFLLGLLFVEPYRAGGYFAERAWHPLGVSVTGQVAAWAQQRLLAPLLGFAGIALSV